MMGQIHPKLRQTCCPTGAPNSAKFRGGCRVLAKIDAIYNLGEFLKRSTF